MEHSGKRQGAYPVVRPRQACPQREPGGRNLLPVLVASTLYFRFTCYGESHKQGIIQKYAARPGGTPRRVFCCAGAIFDRVNLRFFAG
jgi:hypothetical protein